MTPPPTLTERFGQRVRELRRRKNMSLEALGAKCQLHGNFLQKLETGKQTPTLETVEKVSNGLGVPVSQLFTFDEPAPEARKRLKARLDKATEQEIVRLSRVIDATLY